MADEQVAGAKIVITIPVEQAKAALRDLKAAGSDVAQAFEGTLGSAVDNTSKKIKRLADEISGGGATRKLQDLEKAVASLGGPMALTGQQLDNLRVKVDGLAKAGGTVPAGLAGLPKVFDQVTHSATGLEKAMGSLKGDGLAHLQQAATQLGPMGSALSAIGPAGLVAAAGIAATAGAVKGLAGVVMGAADWANKLLDTAAALGTTLEATQRLQAASVATGTDFELVRNSIVKMQEAIVDAPEKLNGLGLALDHIKAMAPEQQFEAIATQLLKIEDPARRNAIAIEIFGKKWADLVPFVEQGFQAMEKATVVSDDTVKSLGDLKAATIGLGREWDTLWNTIGGAVGKSPAIVGGIQAITDALSRMQRAVQSGGFWDAWGNIVAGAFGLKGQPSAPAPINRAEEDRKRLEAGLATRSGVTAGSGEVILGETEGERQQRLKREADAKRERERAAREAQREELARIKKENDAIDDYNQKYYGSRTGPFPSDELFQERQREARIRTGLSSFATFGGGVGTVSGKGSISEVNALPAETARAINELSNNAEQAAEAIAEMAYESKQLDFQKFVSGMNAIGAALSGIEQLAAKMGIEVGTFTGLGQSGLDFAKAAKKDASGKRGPLDQQIGAGIGILTGAFDAGRHGGAVAGGLSGAATGAAAGSQYGPWGGIIGGAVGAGAGLLGALTAPDPKVFAQVANALAQIAGHASKYEQHIKDADEAQKKTQAAVEKYGFTIHELGPAWKQQELNKQAISLYEEYTLLDRAGISHTNIIKRMGPAMQDYFQTAVAAGAAIPVQMRPALEEMVKLGELTDGAGNKMKSLEGLRWTETLEESLQRVVEALDRMTQSWGNIPRSVDTAINVHVNFLRGAMDAVDAAAAGIGGTTGPEGGSALEGAIEAVQAAAGKVTPQFAGGSAGIQNFGARTNVDLHGEEGVFTVPQINRISAAGFTLGAMSSMAVGSSMSNTGLRSGGSSADLAFEIQGLREDFRRMLEVLPKAVRSAVNG